MPVFGQPEVVTKKDEEVSKEPTKKQPIKLTRINSLVCSINGITLNVVEVPNLVQLATRAAKVNRRAMHGSKSLLDRAESVGLGSTRGNASSGESLNPVRKRTAHIMKGREGDIPCAYSNS